MKLPPFVYVLRFWEFLSLIVAGVLGLLTVFNVVPSELAIGSAVVLAWVLGILRFAGIDPKLRVLSSPKPKSKTIK